MTPVNPALQDIKYIVPGAVIRTLVHNLEGATEPVGTELTVMEADSGVTFSTDSPRNGVRGRGHWTFCKTRSTSYVALGLGVGFAIVRSPLFVEQPPTPEETAAKAEQVRIETNSQWVRELMSTTGRAHLPMDAVTEMAKLGSRTEINKAFFTYCEANPPVIQELDEAATTALNNMITPTSSRAYREHADRKRSYMQQAQRCMRDCDANLVEAMKEDDKMRIIEGRASIPLASKIQDVLKAGWLVLPEPSVFLPALQRTDADQHVKFLTPPINLKHHNPSANIMQNVDMGSFEVRWFPQRGRVSVVGVNNNLNADGYQHPHVDSSGSVCWGNAAATYSDAMGTYDIAKALEALQVILQNYNADSPYVRLDRFVSQRNANRNAGMPTKYVQHPGHAHVRSNDMPDNWASTYQVDVYEGEDDDGDSCDVYVMKVFKKVYENGDSIPGEEDTFYIKYRNGMYFAIDESDIQDWG